MGVFHKTNGAKIYDFTVDSSIKYTMKTDCTPSNWAYIGGLIAISYNTTIVNVNVYASISVAQTTTAGRVQCFMGGIVGQPLNGINLYKSSYNGTLYFKTSAKADTQGNGDGNYIGGLIGHPGSGTMIVDQCAVSGVVSFENYGADIGGILGYPFKNSTDLTITNCVLDVQIKALGTKDVVYYRDAGIICGEDINQANPDRTDKIYTINNIYMTSKCRVYRWTGDTEGIYSINGSEGDQTPTLKDIYQNVYLPISSSTPIYPTLAQNSGIGHKLGSTAAVVTEANKNSAITNNFSVSSSGTVTSKLSTFLSTQWADTLPASRVLFTATSTLSLTALSLTNLGSTVPLTSLSVSSIKLTAVRSSTSLLTVPLNLL